MTKNKSREVRRESIVEAAVEEFVLKGFYGASINAIASRAGLTKGGLYHHFSGKDEILKAASERFQEPIVDLISDAFLCESAKEGLTGFIEKYLKHWAGHHKELVFTFLSLAKSLSSPELWPEAAAYAEEMHQFFIAMFHRGIEQGEFVAHEVESRSFALMAALDGVTAYMVMNPELTSQSTAAHFITTFIEHLSL